jgi:hypothetical protein
VRSESAPQGPCPRLASLTTGRASFVRVCPWSLEFRDGHRAELRGMEEQGDANGPICRRGSLGGLGGGLGRLSRASPMRYVGNPGKSLHLILRCFGSDLNASIIKVVADRSKK